MTEAGPEFQGTIKSATAFGILLSEGIGDTIRGRSPRPPHKRSRSAADPPVVEPAERKLEIVSCPSCGRAQVDVYKLANDATSGSRA